MRTLHLCGGIGAGMLADKINGHTPIAYVDQEPLCCQIIRDRCAEGWFPGLAIHECDLRAFDGRPYAGRVDCVSAGWPCQGISRIGTRQGLDDPRSGLWSEVARIIGEIRPSHAFLENGPDLPNFGLDRVLCDLAAMGFDARWCRLSAGNAGASHERERWWCLANRVSDGLEGIVRGGQRRGQLAEAVADHPPIRLPREPATGLRGRSDDYWHDTDGCLSNPPWRGDGPGWERAADHGAPDPGVCGMADADAARLVKARIACIGNSQDVFCAASAWRILGGN